MRTLLKEAISLLENDNRPEVESFKERAKNELSTYFPITSVSREDLESRGFNTQDVKDEDMLELADRMADGYCDDLFWVQVDIIAEEELKLKKHNAEPLKCVEEGCDELQGEDGEYCEKHAK